MTDEGNHNNDRLDEILSLATEWARERFKFSPGDSTLQERMEAVQRLFGGQARMSEAISVSISGIKAWIGKGNEPGLMKVSAIAEKSGVSLDYMASGRIANARDVDCERARLDILRTNIGLPSIDMRREALRALVQQAEAELDAIQAGFRTLPSQAVKQHEDDHMVMIPQFDLRAAAGSGLVPLDSSVRSYASVDREWLRRFLPAWAGTNAIIGILEGAGDSMEPTIHDGDMIMVVGDPPWEAVKRGGIFVVLHHDELRIKRLQHFPRTGDIDLISDNPRYAKETVTRERVEFDLRILGQVFFAGGKLRN